MKEQTQKRPENENDRRNSIDRLTGTWNEEYLRSWITEKIQDEGAMLLCDIDHFQQINDQLGHFKGDKCLKHVAKTLEYMIREGDILGRTGGDEFVIFMPGCQDLHTAQEIGQRIETHFRIDRRKDNRWPGLSVTIGVAIKEKGDTYQTIVKRAEENLACRKAEAGASRRPVKLSDSFQRDMMQIRNDLIEEIHTRGSYCQDYETFKSIYRFLERGLARNGRRACVILFTLTDGKGRILSPHEKDVLMEQLGEAIHKAMRIGDVHTRYSSSQYLALVIDTTEELADLVADRVKGKFHLPDEDSVFLAHCCYALQPARIMGQEKELQV